MLKLSFIEKLLLIDCIKIAKETNEKRIKTENIQEFDKKDLQKLDNLILRISSNNQEQ